MIVGISDAYWPVTKNVARMLLRRRMFRIAGIHSLRSSSKVSATVSPVPGATWVVLPASAGLQLAAAAPTGRAPAPSAPSATSAASPIAVWRPLRRRDRVGSIVVLLDTGPARGRAHTPSVRR